MLETNLCQMNFVICPAFCYLPVMHSKKYLLGAQDVSAYESGAYTGQVSAKMLRSIDVRYVLLNHSELKDSSSVVKQKLNQCLLNHLHVCIFISETEEEHYYQYTTEKLFEQIAFYLENVDKNDYPYISFVYEPSWLIGKERSLTSATIKNLFYILKKELQYRYSYDFPLLYGGGLNEKAVNSLKFEKMIDGFVLGNYSLDVKNVLNLANQLNSDTIRHN